MSVFEEKWDGLFKEVEKDVFTFRFGDGTDSDGKEYLQIRKMRYVKDQKRKIVSKDGITRISYEEVLGEPEWVHLRRGFDSGETYENCYDAFLGFILHYGVDELYREGWTKDTPLWIKEI